MLIERIYKVPKRVRGGTVNQSCSPFPLISMRTLISGRSTQQQQQQGTAHNISRFIFHRSSLMSSQKSDRPYPAPVSLPTSAHKHVCAGTSPRNNGAFDERHPLEPGRDPYRMREIKKTFAAISYSNSCWLEGNKKPSVFDQCF